MTKLEANACLFLKILRKLSTQLFPYCMMLGKWQATVEWRSHQKYCQHCTWNNDYQKHTVNYRSREALEDQRPTFEDCKFLICGYLCRGKGSIRTQVPHKHASVSFQSIFHVLQVSVLTNKQIRHYLTTNPFLAFVQKVIAWYDLNKQNLVKQIVNSEG